MIKRPPLDPDDPMPWGAHAGIAMRDVPLEYLLWLRRQPWLLDWPRIYAYVETRKADLDSMRQTDPKEEQVQTFSTFEDYLKWSKQ
jgi:Putative quorum-sensing-regulated virulence factor